MVEIKMFRCLRRIMENIVNFQEFARAWKIW